MAVCPNCGASCADGAKFCSSCGSPLPAPVQQPTAQPVQPVYQQPQAQGNGVGTAGMVLGIIGMVFTVIGTIILFASGFYGAAVTLIFWLIGGILMLPGFPLSLAGLFGKKPKGKAIAGLILNLLILILWVYLFVAGGSFFRYL